MGKRLWITYEYLYFSWIILMKKSYIWIVIILVVLYGLGFVISRHRSVSYVLQAKPIHNEFHLINAAPLEEERIMFRGIDEQIFSGYIDENTMVEINTKVWLPNHMIWYRLLISKNGQLNYLYLRTHWKQVWFLDDLENCTGYCVNTLLNRLSFDIVPTKVIDIIFKAPNSEPLVLQWSTGDWIDMVERGP